MEEKFRSIGATLASLSGDLQSQVKTKKLSNNQRRKYYSQLELLRLDLQELESIATDTQKDVLTAAMNQIDSILPILNLVPVFRPKRWWDKIEVCLRFIGVVCSFIVLGTACALPLLALRAVDIALGKDPFQYWSEFFKRNIAFFVLYQSGVIVDVQGVKNEYFNDPCALLCFNHASNLDGFLVSGICPIRQLAFGKKELFLVPFFSWISLAFGGVPVDRGNRDRAVGALKRTTDAAASTKMAIAVAPEGTRSNSGQLLPFKKGPFYMWDELKAPIVPMLIYGAYDLYPVGSWVNRTGHVAVRYLPPINASEAKDRDSMLVLLRRRMLEALGETPPSVGEDITVAQWIVSHILNFGVIGSVVGSSWLGYDILVNKHHFSVLALTGWWLAMVFAITAVLYIYYVYIIDMKRGGSSGMKRSASTSSTASDKSDSGKKSKGAKKDD